MTMMQRSANWRKALSHSNMLLMRNKKKSWTSCTVLLGNPGVLRLGLLLLCYVGSCCSISIGRLGVGGGGGGGYVAKGITIHLVAKHITSFLS